jgi:hypothetical protein
MNVKKDVYEKMKGILNNEIRVAYGKLNRNRDAINNLAKEQRVLKSTIGELQKTKHLFK